MPMYNLFECSECSDNYSMRTGSLWNYYKDDIDGVDDNSSESKSFKYNSKIVGKIPARHPPHHKEWYNP